MARPPASIWAAIAAKLILAAGVVAIASQITPATPADQLVSGPAGPVTPLDRLSAVAKAAPASARPAFIIDTALAIDRPLGHGDYAWSDEGVAAGPLWVHVNLSRQTIRVIRGTSEIGRAIILYGADEKPTPTGIFRITEKDADHVSNIYDAPMPHMLRLTNDGIAIHGASVDYGWGTNGCIGVPQEFAALLFAKARLGDRVVITKGDV